MPLVSSRLFLGLFRKRKAILSGMGNPPERRSKKDIGGDERGCNLQPGPDKFYLDGGDMQANRRGVYGRLRGAASHTRG